MTLKTIGHLFYTTSSFVHHFKSIGEVKLKWQSQNAQFSSKLANFLSRVTLKFDWMTLKKNRALLLYNIKLCEAFQNHWYIQTGVTVRKRSIWVKIDDFCVLHDLENWRMTLKNNRATLLCCLKLSASFQRLLWLQTGVTVRNHPIWVNIGDFVSLETLEFDGWPWKITGHLF